MIPMFAHVKLNTDIDAVYGRVGEPYEHPLVMHRLETFALPTGRLPLRSACSERALSYG